MNLSLISVCLFSYCGASIAAEQASTELDYLQEFPIVLSASRLHQPQDEAPNAMTVIDRDMIKASGFRQIADLFRLVPGTYVSNSTGWQPVVAYHGSTDDYARRMQVRVDGRAIYMPPLGAVAWEDLPLHIDDIERIEVIRGPAAASHGGNSTQGVINIITRDASAVEGFKASAGKGNGGIADAAVSMGKAGNILDYRASFGYRSDHGYDAVQRPYNNYSDINNDSYQTRLFNLRGNYHPNTVDSFDFQLGYTNGSRGDGTAKPSDPNSPHDRHNNENFSQLAWIRGMEGGDELRLQYYHIYQDVLNAVPAVAPFPALGDSWTNTRDDLELQHTLHTSPDNRLVWGASTRSDWTRAEHKFLAEQTVRQSTLFAHDELRMTQQWLLNIGAMQEDNGMGKRSTSPRIALIYKAAERQTLRAGISKASRNPSVYEERGNYHFPELGGYTIYQASGGLKPESVLSREIGYLGEFPTMGFTIDTRIYHDQLRDIIFTTTTNPVESVNMFDAEHKGLEITTKHHWGAHRHLTFNYAWQMLSSPFTASPDLTYNYLGTNYSETMPRNMLSALYSETFEGDIALSFGYYQQDTMLPIDRGFRDRQQLTRRGDVRIAKQFKSGNGGPEGEIAWVVQGLFADGHVDYMDSNVYKRRTYLTASVQY
ncbi:MAG: TonB-dependent receptor [Nitrosomonadales bacterium]|nr:TonB-dependent receptor [Nitrosomonadales bacterium]